MKKSYYIAIVAIIAIVCLQAGYVLSLYNNYVDEKRLAIDEYLHIVIDKELHLRQLLRDGLKPQETRSLIIKRASEMTPQELDSLGFMEADSINLDAAKKAGVADTGVEAFMQLSQDWICEDGFPLNLQKLDSIFKCEVKDKLLYYEIDLLDSNKRIVEKIDRLNGETPDCSSELYPIGTKGLQYVQLKAHISISTFIKNEIWILVLSACFMVMAMLCLFFQLTEIRRKTILLRKREDTINGTVHDLKTPLNSVVATLGWLKSAETNVSKKKAVEISQAEVKHLVCNIESLLVTVRKDRKRLVLKKEDIDILHLAEIVKSNMDVLYSAKPHSIEIVSELPEGVKISADGMYIENVIRNLVENALKYSDDGVAVKVTLSVTGRILQVSVQDNGWGIAPAYQKKLFQQFYQVPRGEERIRKGYGIGLAQSKYIIDEHGGKIAVKSAEGEGSVFAFTIPLV